MGMEMKPTTIFKFSAALLLGAGLFTTTALAGSLTLSIVGVIGSGTYGSDAVSPYEMSVTDALGHTSSVLVACNDFRTQIGLNQPWSGNAFTLSSANLANLKFSTLALTIYEQAAVIFTDLKNNPSLDVAGSVAIWSLFEPGSVDVGSVFGAQDELNHAAAAVAAGGIDYSAVKIYTPDPLGASQEFISGDVTPTPEPATYALLGGGLVLLGWARRRTRRD
jgi:hypothetical protein